ncbi:hypothetical protein LTR08_003583 [Meristemomyces frigidus]|nr:hypothetical protein LTR08_003583 [Meristemomyces frigidus]
MVKRTVYTKITPLPAHVPRQLALDMLHSHAEVIQLNPLVTGVKSMAAPRDAASDEFFSQWYEISEVITWGFGMKKKISFKGVFHDQPWGMQSHVYAPMGVDLRNKYRIGGNQPGEPREMRELGVDTPTDGLYLREDVEISCSLALMSFVKKETKVATGIMVTRLTRKAELLDDGMLHAMFEDGMLKTTKPSQQATFSDRPLPSPNSIPPNSPALQNYEIKPDPPYSPATDQQGYGRYSDLTSRRASQSSQRHSSYVPQYQRTGYNGPDDTKSTADSAGMPEIAEMPGDFYQQDLLSPGLYPPPLKSQGQVFRAELPGDYTLAPPQPSAEVGKAQTYQAYQAYAQPSPQPSPGLSNRTSHQQPSPQPSPGLATRHVYQPALPQRSPALPDRHSSSGSSKYRVSNPDVRPMHPAHRSSSGAQTSQQVAEWQRGLGILSPEEPSSTRHSMVSGQGPQSEPDHHRLSQMSMQQTPVQHLAHYPAGKGVGKVSKCPVCGLFEGDEAAVSHHVSKAHFG